MSEGGLVRRGARAALWNYAGHATRLALQFAIGILLARLLGPEAFGTVALAMLMIGLGQLIADFGLNAALIQARELRDGDVDLIFTVQLGLGVALTGLGIALASPIAGFFEVPQAAPVIAWMAPMFAIRAAGLASLAVLSRELRFGAAQFAAITGYLAGYGATGLTLAFSGYGVWSLVAAHLVGTVVTTMLLLLKAGYRPRLRLGPGNPELLRFGRHVIVGNIGNWAAGNLDSMIVGRTAGAASLGLYNRAFSLALVPVNAVAAGLYGVFLAAVSRANDNLANVRKAVIACIVFYIATAGAVLLAFTAASPTVVGALYGAEWLGAAPLLVPLALAMFVHGIASFLGWALTGLGRPEIEARSQWVTAILLLLSASVAAQGSVVAVAWALMGSHAVRLALLARALDAQVGFERRRVAGELLPALAAAVAVALAAAVADRLGAGLDPLARLAVIVAACAATLALALFAVRRLLLRGPLGEFVRKAEIVPARLRRFVAPPEWA